MNTKALAEVLSTEGKGTEKDGQILLGEDTAVTLYASIGSESLVVGPVVSVTLSDDMVLAKTRKGDRFAIVAQDIRALRFGKGESKRRTGLI